MIVTSSGSYPCTVLDMSVIGCRVQLPHHIFLSGEFEFVFVKKNIRLNAKIVWQEDNQAGILFIHEKKSVDAPAG